MTDAGQKYFDPSPTAILFVDLVQDIEHKIVSDFAMTDGHDSIVSSLQDCIYNSTLAHSDVRLSQHQLTAECSRFPQLINSIANESSSGS